MPRRRVPQVKSTAKEYRAGLGKGHRPMAAAGCVLGREEGVVSARRTTLIPPPPLPWKSNRCVGRRVLGGLLCHHGEMELAQKANKISPHLSPPSPDQPCLGDGFFCCSVCLLVWSGAHGYPAWSREEEEKSEGMEDVEQRRGGDEGGVSGRGGEDEGGGEDV